jgi:ribonuclease HI
MVNRIRFLTAGESRVSLYADASYSHDLETGCWAFSIPAFPLEAIGIEAGGSNNHLELAAVLYGLKAVHALDFGKRPVRIHTDSEFVIGVLRHASAGSPLPARKAYRDVAELYDRLSDLCGGRKITATRDVVGSVHHTACDRRARRNLRKYCREGLFSRTILLRRAEARRASLQSQLKQLECSMDRVEQEVLRCDLAIAALRSGQYNSEHAMNLLPTRYAHV